MEIPECGWEEEDAPCTESCWDAADWEENGCVEVCLDEEVDGDYGYELRGTVIFIGQAEDWATFDFASSGPMDYLAEMDADSAEYLREFGIELGSPATAHVDPGDPRGAQLDATVLVFSYPVVAVAVGEFSVGDSGEFDGNESLRLSADATPPYPDFRIAELCSPFEPCDWLWIEADSVDPQVGFAAFAGAPGGTIPAYKRNMSEEFKEKRPGPIRLDHPPGYFWVDLSLAEFAGSGVPGSIRIAAHIDSIGRVGSTPILVIEPRAGALMITAILAITLLALTLPRRSAV